jgi:PQQ-dependent dehydrogenase (methanol/ethanol family)
VKLRDGGSIRGFARTRSNFDIVLQDLDGRLRPIREQDIAAIQEEKRPFMPAVKSSGEDLRNLIAYLSRLTGVTAGAAVVPQPSGLAAVSFPRIAEAKAGDWLSYDGKLTGNRYSELAQINTGNAKGLVLKWSSPIPQFGLEVTPLVADGIMYVAGPNQAYALDARTGRQIWVYSRPRTSGLVGDASLGTNRGMAMLGDNVFMVTDNAHLIALNRTTGSLVWDQWMPEEPQHYGSTVAPLVVKDLVIAGVSGADWGIRGFVAAYKAGTGERAWRHWTIPAKDDPGYETWQGADPKFGGGGTWLTGSYDVATDTLFWATATPWPVSDDRLRGGDNLYTDCILAIDPTTGKLKWHYQYTPHDLHAWDATEPHVLVDAAYRGKPRKLILHADRNGFFYVFDRTNGELLLAKNFVKVTWASGIGKDGRPQLTPDASREKFCPTADPSNWDAAAFSPVTRLFYVMVLEQCATVGPRGNWTSVEHGQKFLRALDIESGQVVWERPQTGTTASKHWAGVLDTAGGVLFHGDPNGDFVAVDEKDGKLLWHFSTNETIKSSPMTYTVDGKQFVALAVGSNIMSFGLP